MAATLPLGASVAELTKARQDAAAVRGEWLTSLRDGMVTLGDLVTHAASEESSPLRALRLATAIEAELATGEEGKRAAARRAVANTLRTLEIEPTSAVISKLTVGWLLEKRAGQRRVLALAEAVERSKSDERRTPWAGFPLAEGTVRS